MHASGTKTTNDDSDVVNGCLEFRYARFRARLSSEDVSVSFWAATDGGSIYLENVERGCNIQDDGEYRHREREKHDEEGLPAYAFNADVGENCRLGMVYDSVPMLCETLLHSLSGSGQIPEGSDVVESTLENHAAKHDAVKHVLELGAGMGLPGLFCALRFPNSARVTLSDRHPGVLELLRRNVELNFPQCGSPAAPPSITRQHTQLPAANGLGSSTVVPEVMELDWDPEKRPDWFLKRTRKFDYVIAADVLYVAGMAAWFFGAAAAALKAPDGKLLLAHKARNDNCHLQGEILPAAAHSGLRLVADAPFTEDNGAIHVFEFKLADDWV